MSTWRPLTLEEAVNVPVLSYVFDLNTAVAISNHLRDFLPYQNEFPSYFLRITSSGNSPKLEAVWNVRLRVADPNRAMFIVAIVYNSEFPNSDIQVYLRVSDPSKMCVKRPYNLIGDDGSVFVSLLPSLYSERRPYSIISILTALSRQFEQDYPFLYIGDQGASNFQDTHPFSMHSHIQQISEPPAGTKHKFVEDIAENILININQKASEYLDARKQFFQYMKTLRAQNEELEKAKAYLIAHKEKLSEYLPSSGSVSSLLQQLKGREDTIEEHAKSLMPGDALQARALELVVDSLALDDMMGLLDDGLKSEKLSCDEYVKLITDLSREQFLSRFAYQKIQPQLSASQSASASSSNPITSSLSKESNPPYESAPPVPKRLSPEEALNQQFPRAGISIIRDVLSNLNNDISAASAQLKTMFP